MEADWTVALAAADPVITVPWSASGEDARKCKFVDLRLGVHLIDEIEEARSRPVLRSALLLLNGAASQFWTVKCDSWSNSADEGTELFDRYEMDAEPEETAFGAGSYIDLLPRDAENREPFAVQERWIRAVTERLRAIPGRAARVELVLRHAEVEAVPGFGVTWFVEGCGATADRAEQRWSEALARALAVIMNARLV
jgi:hypothetical protein